jgi:hypothetical protein
VPIGTNVRILFVEVEIIIVWRSGYKSNCKINILIRLNFDYNYYIEK